ncbi:TolC family protein [Myroides marinus]|uniref:TolC family protein n=1 Tax=Myroides marinus TaxID=703342 RepID=UPI0025785E3C|nr:TolC family protein [Myroides marinus]MDM1367226.1 TolC family protein [Myroides marinus]MDM1374454.1 TolC family protein [Myroides marinus]MDM1381609.1 TolC family protein [Myroides marinus]
MKRLLLTIATIFISSSSMSIYGQENTLWSLEKCIDYAIQHNIRIKQYELDEQSAEINKDIVIGSFMPSVNLTGNHSWTIADQLNQVTSNIESQTIQSTTLGLGMNVDLYNGSKKQNTLVKARLSHLASQYQLQKMKEDIALNVINSYLQILFNKELVKTNKQQLEYDKSQEERTQELVDAGVVPRGDLLEAQATVAVATQRLIISQNELVMARLNLAQLLQITSYESFDVVDKDYEIGESKMLAHTAQDISDRAAESLTDLKTADVNVHIAEQDVKIAKSAYSSSLQAFYNLGTNINYQDRLIGMELLPSTSEIGYVEGSNQRVLRNNSMAIYGGPNSFFNQFSDNFNSNFGVSLRVPIFNGFSTKNNVKLKKLMLKQIENEREVKALNLEQLVFKAYTDTESALKKYEASNISLDARKLSLQYAKERYSVGMISIFDLNQNQNLYVSAQSDLLRSKYEYIFKTKILEYYFGIPLFKN